MGRQRERQHSTFFIKNHFGVNSLTSVWLTWGNEEKQRWFYLGYLLIPMARKGYLQKK